MLMCDKFAHESLLILQNRQLLFRITNLGGNRAVRWVEKRDWVVWFFWGKCQM